MSEIVIEDVTMRFDGADGSSLVALEGITERIEDRSFVSIVGPSGCGKSTLLAIVSGLQRASSGTVMVGERTVTKPSRRIGVIFQGRVEDNVKFGMQIDGVDRAERDERARSMIELVGLEGFEQSYPATLSGGMRQRVAIARTLSLRPDVLLMDEPFGALDPQTRLMIGAEVRRIWQRTGTTVMFVTHDIQEAILLSEEVWVMSYRPGRIIDRVSVGLTHERGLGSVGTPEFSALQTRIWENIRNEVMHGMERRRVAVGQPRAESA